MFGFRFFLTLGMAFCLCISNWAQTHAANAETPLPRLVAAADAKLEKAKKRRSESKASKTQSNAKPGTRKKLRENPKTHKITGSSARASTKYKKRRSLPPASAALPQSGVASWVGPSFHGRPVANGETYVMEGFTAAHRAIPFDSILKVTDMNSGRSILVRVNDRGPYIRGRVIDLSRGAAEYLGFVGRGVTTVRLESAGSGKDSSQRYYIRTQPAKGAGKTGLVQGFGPFDKFDEAASLFATLYKSCPDAELLIVREKG